MKVIRCDLPKEIKQLELHPLADMHLGDSMCAFKRIQSVLKHIAETPNAYCVLNGDLMDSAIASSIGDTYGANLQPQEQLEQCVKIFGPVKDKVLCVAPGNHENRIYRATGIDITSLMCAQLGILDRYTPTTAYLFIRFGETASKVRKMCYTAYVTHGTGGGRKEGGKINKLSDLAQICDADIYITAHTHLPAAFKNGFYRVDTANSAIAHVNKLYVNCAASLEYGGYGDVQGYKPPSLDNPVIFALSGKKKAYAIV